MGYPWSRPIRRGDAMLASDITELRDQIQYQGGLAGLNPPITWNPASINQGDWILASHFRDMRAAIQRLWTSKNRGSLPMWSSGIRPGGPSEGVAPTSILATDVTDLRRWLDIYIDNHPRLGMDTKSYDAASRNRLLADNASADGWIPDIAALAPPTPSRFMVRCEVNSPVTWLDPDNPDDPDRIPVSWNSVDRGHYRTAYSRIRMNSGAIVYPLLSKNFVLMGTTADSVKQPLNVSFSNSYIDQFSDEAVAFSRAIASSGARDFIIWNEPNGNQGVNTPPQNFAALLYHCYNKLKADSSDNQIYWGGILCLPKPTGPDTVDNNKVDPANIDYFKGVYEAVSNFHFGGIKIPLYVQGELITQKFGPWPWDGVNVHVHRDRTSGFVSDLFDQVRNEMRFERGDWSSRVLVGECGITIENYRDGQRLTNSSGSAIFNRLIERADLLCLFSHHVHPEENEHWGTREFGEGPPSSFTDRTKTGRFILTQHLDPNDPPSNPMAWEHQMPLFWNHVKNSFAAL